MRNAPVPRRSGDRSPDPEITLSRSPALPERPIERDPLPNPIGRQVLRALGTPKDPIKARVHPLAVEPYPVNVEIGAESTGRIAQGDFLPADEKGEIGTSTPAIAKLHGSVAE